MAAPNGLVPFWPRLAKGLQKSPDPSPEYNFNYPHRGTAVIINNMNFVPKTMQKPRDGAKSDTDNLQATFDLLGFKVLTYENMTTTEMMLALKQVASEDHSQEDCFTCVISSHGDQDVLRRTAGTETIDIIYGVDGVIHVKTLIELFKPRNCPSLAGKPKLFFIQACRGASLSESARVEGDGDEDEVDWGGRSFQAQSIPICRDFLLAYSAPPGFYSFRRSSGSWFITCLCQVLQTMHQREDLLTMLTLVNHQMAYEFASNTPGRENKRTHRRRIVPWICSMLIKNVFFHPKSQEDERITFV